MQQENLPPKTKIMQSHELDFQLLYDLKWFSIVFDTEGPHKNLLMSVYMESYPIDTIDLRTSHKILFAMIETRMRKEAEIFWNQAHEDRKEKFDKMPDVGSMMDMIHEQILKPYNEAIRKGIIQ